jgi:hypothetical protein
MKNLEIQTPEQIIETANEIWAPEKLFSLIFE